MTRFLILFLFIINSCAYPKLSSDELVYENNFEDENLTEIDGATISLYNNTKVLGNYNNDGFTLPIISIDAPSAVPEESSRVTLIALSPLFSVFGGRDIL